MGITFPSARCEGGNTPSTPKPNEIFTNSVNIEHKLHFSLPRRGWGESLLRRGAQRNFAIRVNIGSILHITSPPPLPSDFYISFSYLFHCMYIYILNLDSSEQRISRATRDSALPPRRQHSWLVHLLRVFLARL